MKKGLKGVCAMMLTLSMLTAVFTACGSEVSVDKGVNNTSSADAYAAGNNNSFNSADPAANTTLAAGLTDGNGSNTDNGGYADNSGSSNNSGSGSNQGSSYNYTPVTQFVQTDVNSNTGSGNNGQSQNSPGNENPTATTEKTTRTPTHDKNVDPEKVLNSAKLNPMTTNDADLDERVDAILAEVTTPNMSTYQKVRRVYNYLVQTNKYGYMAPRMNENVYVSVYDNDVVTRAKTLLKTKRGTCVDFSAAFMAITRRIGLECYLITGKTIDKWGNESLHGWNVIRINGVDYGFDSEADFRFADGGETKYWIFCVNDPVKFKEVYTNLAATAFMKFKTF